MKSFCLYITLPDDQIELSLTSDATDVDNIVLDLMMIFATKIDNQNHKLELSYYPQNTQTLRENIALFCARYKGHFPALNRLEHFLDSYPDGDYFFINTKPSSQSEQLQILASIETLNTNGCYDEVLQKYNDIFSSVMSEYTIFTYHGRKKRFYGEPDQAKRVCRFCHSDMSSGATFHQKCHTISESLGNKTIMTNEECDTCNNTFGNTIEQDFADSLLTERCFFGIKGKNGVPPVEGVNFKMKNDPEGGLRVDFTASDTQNVKPEDIELHYTYEAAPQDIYRCLAKYVVGVMPSAYKQHFVNTGVWISGKHNVIALPKVAILETHSLYRQPSLIIYIRNKSTKTLPFAVAELRILNRIYSYIIPCCSEDDRDFVKQEDYDTFWNHFRHYTKVSGWKFYNMSDSNRQILDSKTRFIFDSYVEQLFDTQTPVSNQGAGEKNACDKSDK